VCHENNAVKEEVRKEMQQNVNFYKFVFFGVGLGVMFGSLE
jgi:hypothetical protein